MATIIPWTSLLWCLVPIVLVAAIFYRWRAGLSDVFVASARMFIQLLAVGYVLVVLFEQSNVWLSLMVVGVMLVVAAWIAIRPVKQHPGLWLPSVFALGVSVLFHLFLSLFLIIPVEVWYQPNILIPLAGMYFANSMNSISLATERYFSERKHNLAPWEARNRAFKASMIPQINGLLAVGLVALPGMMTGQILSGVSPLIAVRYQILIMTMILGTTGIGAAVMLWILSRKAENAGAGQT